MGEFITNIFNAFLELMRQFRAVDVLDIVVVAFLIYSLIKLVREIFTNPLGTKPVQPVLVVSVCPFFLHHYYQVFRYPRCHHLSYRYLAIDYCQ